MEQKSNAFLEEEKLSMLMRKYSLPCIISLVVAALYNIVDQIFIANADYLGSHGNAANTVVFPLTVVALAIAVMIGDGACAFVSISLGADRKEDAHRSIGNAIVLCLGSSLMLTAVYFLAMEPILTFFGGVRRFISCRLTTVRALSNVYLSIGQCGARGDFASKNKNGIKKKEWQQPIIQHDVLLGSRVQLHGRVIIMQCVTVQSFSWGQFST